MRLPQEKHSKYGVDQTHRNPNPSTLYREYFCVNEEIENGRERGGIRSAEYSVQFFHLSAVIDSERA